MKKKLAVGAVVLLVGIGALLTSQTHVYPALDTANSFTGVNSFNNQVNIASQGTTTNSSNVFQWNASNASSPVTMAAQLDNNDILTFTGSSAFPGILATSYGIPTGTNGDFFCHHGPIAAGLGVCFFADVNGSAASTASEFLQFESLSAGTVDLLASINEDAKGNILLQPSNTTVNGGVSIGQLAFASLPVTPPVGTMVVCTNCVVTTSASCSTNTPASCVCQAGTGSAIAKYINYQNNGVNWYCQ